MKGFVIDTDSYSGNFERELCAYITGVIGDCGVGAEKIEFEEMEGVVQVPDEYGCHRPVAMYETPGYFNNGYGFAYIAGEEDLAVAAFKKSVIEDQEKWMRIEESHRGENIPTWDDKAIDGSIANRKQKIKEANAITEPSAYPSYQSIIIQFEDKYLTPEVILLLKSRALNYNGDFKIENFRMVSTTTITNTVDV